MSEATHETLAADIEKLRSVVFDLKSDITSIREGDARHTAEIVAIHTKLTEGQNAFGEIKTLISGISIRLDALALRRAEDRDEVRAQLLEDHKLAREQREKDGAAIAALIAAENQRAGRDGVWSAIARSPFFAWLTAAGAAVAAFFSWIGGKQ